MIHLDKVNLGQTIKISFNTYDANGASVTVTDLVAGDVKIHKDGGLTQRTSSAGITVSIDFDGITGNHIISIDLSDNTDAGFYALGSTYQVRLEGITVVTQTLNSWVGIFSVRSAAESYALYAGGVWIDDAAANANTVVGVDGLPSNPVSTLAAARTIADALGVKKYYIVNDSTLTLAATHLNWEFIGKGLRNQLDLGSQSVNDSYFEHLVLSGTQGGAQKIEAYCCYLNGIIGLKIIAKYCFLTATNTLAVGTLNIFDHCSSNVPGGSTPALTFQAGVTSIGVRHYSGGLQLNNMTSDHTVSFEAKGQLIVDASCTSGNISARGNMKITDNGTTTNLTDEAVYNQTLINEQVDAALNSAIPGSPGAGSVNEVLKNQSGAASTLVEGAATAGTLSTTEMTTDLSEATDDHYNGRTIIWTSGVLLNQATAITDYDGATKKLVYVATTEAPSIGDTFVII